MCVALVCDGWRNSQEVDQKLKKREKKKGEKTHDGMDGRKTERRLGELVRAACNCCSDPAPLVHPAHPHTLLLFFFSPPLPPLALIKEKCRFKPRAPLLPPQLPWQQHHSDAISVTGAQLFQTRRNHGGRRWRTPWWQQRRCPLVTSRSQVGEVGGGRVGEGAIHQSLAAIYTSGFVSNILKQDLIVLYYFISAQLCTALCYILYPGLTKVYSTRTVSCIYIDIYIQSP